MNEVLHAIQTRRSTRSFTAQPIDDKILAEIVEAGRAAPSAMNKQPCLFAVVTNKEKISALCAAVGSELGREDYNMYSPMALILTCAPRDALHPLEDCACANENMFLAAHSLGVGSVWINQLKGMCDREGIRSVLGELEIPDNFLVWGTVALGYPAAESRTIEKTTRVVWIK